MTRREFIPALSGICSAQRERSWQQVWHDTVPSYRGPREVYKGQRSDGLWCMATAPLMKYWQNELPFDPVQRSAKLKHYFGSYLDKDCKCEATPMVSHGPHAQECPVHVWEDGIAPGCWTTDRDIVSIILRERSCV